MLEFFFYIKLIFFLKNLEFRIRQYLNIRLLNFFFSIKKMSCTCTFYAYGISFSVTNIMGACKHLLLLQVTKQIGHNKS